MSSSFRFALLPDHRVLLNNYSPAHPCFVILDKTYAPVRMFGKRLRASESDLDGLQFNLASGRNGEIIASPVNYRYVVEMWDTTGTLTQRMMRDADWFTPWTVADRAARGPRSRPLPRITSVHYDDQGRLWVAAVVADRNWRRPPQRSRTGERTGVSGMSVGELARYYDTIIDVLDIRSGRVVLSQRFDALVTQFLENGLVYGLREDPSGLLQIALWSPVIQRL